MNRRIVIMILIALASLVMTVGFTWAGISDMESSASNNLVSGKLDQKPVIAGSYSGSSSLYHVTAGGEGVNGKVVFDRVAPGQSGTIKWVLENTGTVAGTLSIAATSAFSDGVTAVPPEVLFAGNNAGGNGDLDSYLMVTLQRGVGATQAAAEGSYAYFNGATPWAISGLEAVLESNPVALAAAGGNDTTVYLLNWSLSGTDPSINITQGDTAQIDLTFNLTQN
jgi:hypothetical protein